MILIFSKFLYWYIHRYQYFQNLNINMLLILSFSKQVPIWYWHLKNTDIDISSKSMKNYKICFWLLVWFHNKHARSTLHHISTRSLWETNLWCSKVFSVIHYDPPCYNSMNCQVLTYSSELPQFLHYSPSHSMLA